MAAAPQGGAEGRREMARAPPRRAEGREEAAAVGVPRPGPAVVPAPGFPAGRRRPASLSSSSCCCGSARLGSLRPAAGGGRGGSVEVGEGERAEGHRPVPVPCWWAKHIEGYCNFR